MLLNTLATYFTLLLIIVLLPWGWRGYVQVVALIMWAQR